MSDDQGERKIKMRKLEPRGIGSPEEVGLGDGCLGLFLLLAIIPTSMISFGLYCIIA